MAPASYREWVSLLFSALRKEPRSPKYKYRTTIWEAKELLRERNRASLQIDTSKEVKIYSNRTFLKLSPDRALNVLLRDFQLQPEQSFRLIRTDVAPRKKLKSPDENWNKVFPLFENRIVEELDLSIPKCAFERESFNYCYALGLWSRDKKTRLSQIAWPHPIFSFSCVGLGVRPEVYSALKEEGHVFINPANSVELPYFSVDSKLVPKHCDAVALCPRYVPEHVTLFEEGAININKDPVPCTGEELSAVTQAITCTYLPLLSKEPFRTCGDDLAIWSPTTDGALDKRVFTLDRLYGHATLHKRFWSRATYTDRSCPGDIIRSTILSNNSNMLQLMEEFMKHYTTFNLYSFCWRTLNDQSSAVYKLKDPVSFTGEVKPWDAFIWNEYQTLEKLPVPHSVDELVSLKAQFDEFLKHLSRYYAMVTCEMKQQMAEFFVTTDADSEGGRFQDTPRVVPTTLILRDILLNGKWFKHFYPGLHLLMSTKIPSCDKLDDCFVPLDDTSIALGCKLDKLVKEILLVESYVYGDKIPPKKLLIVNPSAEDENWKIVILIKDSIPNHLLKTLKFNTKISIQIVKDIRQATGVENGSCSWKKMIDENVFIYAYKLETEPSATQEDTNRMIKNVIDEMHKGN
ncbi:Cbp2p KNAG_0J02950 [Huiozyma naganishii CBS 8797]|uniref:Uncharacterized protein n=1 Tax=Huiozyma naganishii (strain ATCC MYA-139 / BCRC 22969 / CBS 8797 / KCTC 17520 / NBRC 10181 / NCYC 3082 / Yp74L-3) TaxID=1071383 RepID=J7S9Y5_HUIN7|nr:hypothetical protein KNAG_0J02950 [Kazachstania naganishii CBS 8797]CCK72374.1 hypothetical protein KNAG_0J02950 [Kazachstania naganishii CBS 8797]